MSRISLPSGSLKPAAFPMFGIVCVGPSNFTDFASSALRASSTRSTWMMSCMLALPGSMLMLAPLSPTP